MKERISVEFTELFGLGGGITLGHCGHCDVFHFDVQLSLSWMVIYIHLGQRIPDVKTAA